MTITRLGQLTAETRVLADLTLIAGTILPTITSTRARTGTYSYALNSSAGAFGPAISGLQTAIRMGYWQYLTNTISDAVTVYYAGQGLATATSSNHIRIMFEPDTGDLMVRRPSGNNTYSNLVTVSAPSQYVTTGEWFHVGITHKIAEVDGFISLYINGARVLHYTGDTRPCHWNGSAIEYRTSANRFLGAGRSAAASTGLQGNLDDIFIDSYDDEDDAPVPARRFLMALPDGAGVDDDWTTQGSSNNYENVDDNPNDGDATYNKATTAGLRDTFAFSDISVPTDHRIVAVLPSPFAKRLDSAIDAELSVHAWDGSQYADSPDLTLSMGYDVPVFHRFTTQPDGSPWDETAFNGMQFGYKSAGTFT
jgi:hypothetical protein